MPIEHESRGLLEKNTHETLSEYKNSFWKFAIYIQNLNYGVYNSAKWG